MIFKKFTKKVRTYTAIIQQSSMYEQVKSLAIFFKFTHAVVVKLIMMDCNNLKQQNN